MTSKTPPTGSTSESLTWYVRHRELSALVEQRRAASGRSGGWTFEALGKAVGLSGAAISNICNGKTRQPSPRVLCDLAELLDVPVETIVWGRLPLDVDWLPPEVVEGLRRLRDPQRQHEVTRCLQNLLWLGAQRSP